MIKRFMVILPLTQAGAIRQMKLSQVAERRTWEVVEIYKGARVSRSVSCSHNNRECIMHHKMLAFVAGAAISALMLAPDTVFARDGLRGGVRGGAIGAYRSSTIRSRGGAVRRRGFAGWRGGWGWNPYYRFGNGWGGWGASPDLLLPLQMPPMNYYAAP
jgi:hypothetical protein